MPSSPRRSLDQIFGISLAISLEFDEAEAPQFAVSRVEDVQGNRLWVAMPMRAGMYLPLPVNSTVAAHIKHEDATYVLPTRVVSRRLQPMPMLELQAIGEVQRRQQRQHVRLQIVLVPIMALIAGPDGTDVRLATTIVNISAGGALLRTRQKLTVDQEVHLSVELPVPDGAISITARVLRVETRRADRGLFYEAGCGFLDLADQDRDLITKFIFRAQTRQRQETSTLQ